MRPPLFPLDIDSGASSHMTGARDMFTKMTKTRLDLEVVLGDDTIVRVVGRGTINFRGSPWSP